MEHPTNAPEKRTHPHGRKQFFAYTLTLLLVLFAPSVLVAQTGGEAGI